MSQDLHFYLDGKTLSEWLHFLREIRVSKFENVDTLTDYRTIQLETSGKFVQ